MNGKGQAMRGFGRRPVDVDPGPLAAAGVAPWVVTLLARNTGSARRFTRAIAMELGRPLK